MIKVGVIGIGYWGPNIVRNLVGNPQTDVLYCSDLRTERLNYVTSLYPKIKTTTDHTEIIKDPAVDAVAICTPVFTHHEIALAAL